MQNDSRPVQHLAQTGAVPSGQVVCGGIQDFGLPDLKGRPGPGAQLPPEFAHHCPQGFRHGGSAPPANDFGGPRRGEQSVH
jgi:hypothetical protein